MPRRACDVRTTEHNGTLIHSHSLMSLLTSRSIRQRSHFKTDKEHKRYCTSSEVTNDRESNDPSFKELASQVRSLRCYTTYTRGDETIYPLHQSMEQALQHTAQATDGTKVAFVLVGKCPKDKSVGQQDLATHSCNEDTLMDDCLTVRVLGVVDKAIPDNGIVTRRGQCARWINGRALCKKGGECGCLNIRDFEADNIAGIENRISKFLYDEHGVFTVYINAGGASVKSMVMPKLLDSEYTYKIANGIGWHLCTYGIRYG